MNMNNLNPQLKEIHPSQRDKDTLKPRLSVPPDGLDLLVNPNKTKYSSSSESDRDDDPDSENNTLNEEPPKRFDYSSGTDQKEKNNINNFQDFFNINKENKHRSGDDSDSDESTKSLSLASEKSNHSFNSNISNSSSNGSGSNNSRRMPPKREKTMEEILAEKQEFLFRLERLEAQGYPPSKKFTINSRYEDIKMEYDRLKRQRDVKKSIKFSRNVLMAFVSGVEFLNDRFDPFDIKLGGWTQSINENLDDYDEIFEELHDKYKEKVKTPPELRLLMMVGGSAFMFHMSNSLFKSNMPNLDDVLRQNPDLANNLRQATANSMENNMRRNGDLNNPIGRMAMNSAKFATQTRNTNNNNNNANPNIRVMKGPSGIDVDEILGSIKKDITTTNATDDE